jgi:formylglycine-generating enzyme required for sulfatase activity
MLNVDRPWWGAFSSPLRNPGGICIPGGSSRAAAWSGKWLICLLLAAVALVARAEDPRGMKVLYREPRAALVIGNGAYASSPLANPVNDAEAMARLLERRNFKVTLITNADLRKMEAAVDLFGRSLGAGGVGLFFYAGHGMQIGGHNYLIPVGARIENERDAKYNAFNVGKVLGKMEDAGNRLNIVFLDACRDNPFARSFRNVDTGLAQMDAPSGTLIAYATAPGKVAADGVDSSNSVYTRYLLEQLGVPGQEIGPALRAVRAHVVKVTHGKQTPWESTSLMGNFYLTPIDMLDENLALSRAQLESLRKLQAEQEQAAANLKKLEDEKNAEMARMDAEIARLRRQAQQPGQSGSSLDQILALGRKRTAAAAELAAAQRKAEAERRKREAEIAQVKAAARAKRKAEFETAYKKYEEIVKIVEQGFLGTAEHQVAWRAICGDFSVKNPGDKPAALRVDGLGWTGTSATGQSRTVDLGGGVSLELVWIPADTFTMGSPSGEANRGNDETQHRVKLTKGFWMGKYEVTQEQWQAVMGSNPSHFKGSKNPVEQVSWDDCQSYIQQLNRKVQGVGFRLPTEAEWEYACRAGTTTAFHYGNDLDASLANFDGNYPYGNGRKGEYRRKTVPVGSFKPNAFGLYDMHGNVWEWCQDWYGAYPSGAVTDPAGPGAGSSRVLRGGSWNNNARNCRSANRNNNDPGNRNNNIGFRVVLR